MRLRLRIERNELPAVSVLWTIEPNTLKQTVAQFLQRVDERVPLEGESWGLEDYAVAVGGYEAFHFSEVGDCFQNEDEVIIKPLQFVDVRARTITGRDQITSDGRHLLDGIPFGKPLLKRPRRPDVRIPPRKRQRVEQVEDVPDEEDEWLAAAIARLEDEDSDDDEEDADFGMGKGEAEDGAEEEEEEEEEEDEDESDEDRPSIRTRRTRRQRLIDDEAEELDEDEEEGEVSDTSSSEDSDTSQDDSDVSDSSNTSSSDSDDAASEKSWNGIETSPTKPTAPLVNGSENDISPPKMPEIPHRLVFTNPPFEGSDHTKSRNARRRDQRKLKHLKESGVLPGNATMSDMKTWEKDHGVSNGLEVKKVAQSQRTKTKKVVEGQTIEVARQRLVDQIFAGGVDVAGESQFQYDSHIEVDGKPTSAATEAVLTNGDRIEQDAVSGGDEASEDEAPDEEPSAPPTVALDGIPEQHEDAVAESVAASRRARIDLAGTNRLVFGSLGVRTPKNQADKDALQKKLSARASRNVLAKETESAEPEHGMDQDPEAWRDKIELSAVECCDEGIKLSAPPFPFQQRWDPQYQYSKKRKGPAKSSKNSKASRTANGMGVDYVESYDKYNTNGESDALNYDDPEDDEEDDSYWEEGALLEDDGEEMDEQPVDDGFPSLPSDLATLPVVAEADAQEGDFITYKQLICSAATNWTPTTVDRTVKLGSKADNGGWNVTFATRDKRRKEYDNEGNRVYAKFEMEGLSDDEDELDVSILLWSALQEPKLLKCVVSE